MIEDPADLAKSDELAIKVLAEEARTAPEEIQGQLRDNIHWIEEVGKTIWW
jgi:urocanate hydratase